MTRLYFHAGHIRVKALLWLLLCLLFFGGVYFMGFLRQLGFSPAGIRQQSLAIGALLWLAFSCSAAVTWIYLRPVVALLQQLSASGKAEAVCEERARTTALRYPLFMTILVLCNFILAAAAGVIVEVLVFKLEARLVASLTLAGLTMMLAAATLLYVVNRALIRPIVAHFRHEQVPDGIRVSIRTKVAFAIVVLCLVTSIPTALICANRIEMTRTDEFRLNQIHLAEAIAFGGTVLPPEALQQSIAALHLSGGQRITFTDTPGPFASPLPAAHEFDYIELIPAARGADRSIFLVFLVVFLVGAATFVGSALGANVTRDITLVTGKIMMLTQPAPGRQQLQPLFTGTPQFKDLRHLADTVNLLLDRFNIMHMAHFLAIEKTLAADRLKMQFLANVSHDLRSPLNSILGFSELLLRDTDAHLEAHQRTAIETIFRCGNELLRLIDEVLDSARLEAGRIGLHREDCMITEIVTQTLHRIRRDGDQGEVEIDVELQAGMGTAWLDAHRIGQALEHLLRYSIAAMDRGRVVIRINTLKVERRQATDTGLALQIRLADTSQGLSGEQVVRLFAGFRRKPGVRGLGLGLPLARAFIEKHGGTLQIFSTPGVGTTFIIEIPMLQRGASGRLRSVQV